MTEYTHVEKPFLDQLRSLGWTVIDQGRGVPSDPTKSLRTGFREWILPEVFRDAIRRINALEDGTPWLTDRQLDELKDQILRQPNRSLLEANENVQSLFLKTQVDVNEVTGESDPVVKLIDFDHPELNSFHAINQFLIETPGCVKKCIIPDIVLFVNGMPLVVVEAKIGDATTANPMHDAFVQLLRYRNGREETERAGLREGEPGLFFTNLIIIRTCGETAEFGSITSGEEHFYAWKDIYPSENAKYTPPLGVERQQEKLIQGLLAPATLVHVLRTCTVFMDTDSGARIKVLCRYQQYRAACKIIERLKTEKTPEGRSGVVWHTQGSGKSLTMVFVARMIRADESLQDFKIVLVNDRIDLEKQLTRTAKLIGGKVHVIESTTALREDLSTEASNVNMVMAHKFMEREEAPWGRAADVIGKYHSPPSGKTFGVVNPSDRILLMIDEAHRTQGSDLGDNIFEAFPNATRIAFTGTPLITEKHGTKRTVLRFGEYIDKYKLMDAVNDGATLQILYEGKTSDTALRDRAEFDRKFEDLFRDRTEAEIAAIKKKYGTTGDILEAENRIEAIAEDLVDHYLADIFPDGFKAQVVCHSKLAAVRYQRSISKALADRLKLEKRRKKPDSDLVRKLERLKAVVVVSGDPVNELAEITDARNEAKRLNAVANFLKPFNFDAPDEVNTGIAFLVVCDMLLTGFDAPVEQVMYIDKRLREHGLLQAIARVNRVSKGKNRGYIVDYIGIINHLSQALSIYSGEDVEDIRGGWKDRLAELPILEERYRRLLQHFQALGIKDIEAFVTDAMDSPGAEVALIHRAIAALKDIEARANFEVYLKNFLQSLNIILPHPAGHPFRGPARRFGYILVLVKERYKDDSLNIAGAGAKVRALINEHLVGLGIDPKIPPVELLSDEFIEQVEKHAKGNIEAKASEMEHAIRKHCKVNFEQDPVFYQRLSEKLEKLIKEHRDQWELLAEEYAKLRQEAVAGRREAVEGLSREASVFYENVVATAFEGGKVPPEVEEPLKKLMIEVVALLRETIGILDFWNKTGEVRRLKGDIEQKIVGTDIDELVDNFERIAVEIVELAKHRHEELLK